MSDDNQNDQSFNEEELQDIMSEIEDLEKEYVEDGASSAKVEDDLQATIDKEIEDLNALEAEIEAEENVATEEATPAEATSAEATSTTEDNVVSIVKEKPVTSQSDDGTFSGAPVEFTANGDMNLSMNFTVGESTATLMVSKERGLCVQMDGVNLEIAEDGCTVELAGGVKFTVPLTTSGSELNKKAS
ncbi:MAG: hypothetical protein KC493_10295 [Bacteriovoracaceae bacterium]|nr:hypothetical protein [Bacteriovoracaceae bacterium]